MTTPNGLRFGRNAVFAVILITMASCAAPQGKVRSIAAGETASGLATLKPGIETRAEGRYPGAAFAVARGRRVLELGVTGFANRDTGEVMRSDSIFRLMSMTKPVTAVAVMILVEDGKLELEAPVSSLRGRPAVRNRLN